MKLNVWSVTLASVITAVVMTVLTLPFRALVAAHMMRVWSAEGGAALPGAMMRHPMLGGGFGIAALFVGLLVVVVYSGIAGALFAAIYNALVARQPAA
jgi:hypothetical protein